MFPRSFHPFRLLSLFSLFTLLVLALPLSMPAHAAQPGEQLFNRSGSLAGGQSLQDQPIYSFSGQANLRLEVSNGSGAETMMAMVKDSGGTIVTTFVVRTGETVWGTVALPLGARVMVTNTSGVTLNYTLTLYAVATAPTIAQDISTWSGTSASVGIQSSITIDAPIAGLYHFTLSATSGAYQLVVDTNTLRKTVKTGNGPDPADSVYYLSAGAHTLTIAQDPEAGKVTGWNVNIEPLGGSDVLPSSESSAVLGGGSFFREEWIPLFVTEGAAVDLRIAVSGSATDSLSVELYNGGDSAFTSTNVLGGEVTWANMTLTAGANALHIIAHDGNVGPLGYNLQIQSVPQAPFSWSGATRGAVDRPVEGISSIQMTFPTSGLYTFGMVANSGRFQFMLSDDYIQKTVTDTTSTLLSAYIQAGTYTLKVAQDPQQPLTDWKITIQPGDAASDSLPYVRRSGTLGASDGSAFDQEWLPLQSNTTTPINLKIIATGATSDSLRIELYNGNQLKYAAANVYGGEVFWAPADIISGTNRLHIVANGQHMGYELTVASIADIPATWAGSSSGGGLHPMALLQAPTSGVYDVVLNVDQGEARLLVGDPITISQDIGIATNVISLRVELAKGLHAFTVEQDSTITHTVWSMSVSLRRETLVDVPTYSVYLPVVKR